ncbi:YncE family protein [Roseateles sp. BYS96W]|uniref:YncE family protein n=1 Tax=Pelomonas nitida TaxID=3299027 RepID=A0ABW7G0I6_9BURK
MRLTTVVSALSLCVLSACGGGGGSMGSDAGPITTPAQPGFPTLVTSASFSLPAIDAPAAQDATTGQQQGRLLIAATVPASTGALVELVDATTAATPVVLSSTRTTDAGTFTLNEPSGSRKLTDLWIRVTLADGTVLRAFATGWVEVSPGTEVAVQEVARLLKSGAFAGRALTRAELDGAQQAATLYWQGDAVARSPAAAVAATRDALRLQARWNAMLAHLALPTPDTGTGDIAGLMAADGATWDVSVNANGKVSTDTLTAHCFADSTGSTTTCGIASTTLPDLSEQLTVRQDAIRLQNLSSPEVLDQVLAQVGDLPLVEFPYAVGTKVLVDNPQLILQGSTNVHAAVRITRRTYPVSALQALDGTVPAIRVVLDYEIAVMDTTTFKQADLLARETRWFAPRGGRVRIESSGLARSGTQVQNAATSVVANAVKGSFFPGPVAPFAAPTDTVIRPLRSNHAVYAQALGVIYAASPDNGGQVLELHPSTLATLRTAPLGRAPTHLAVSSDGRRLYAALAGGTVTELSTTDLSTVRSITPIADPYGVPYDQVNDLAVDPADPERLLVLAASSHTVPSGAVLLYDSGTLLLRDAPRYYATDYGWGYYGPTALAWTSTPAEFMTLFNGSPQSVYRFHAGATSFTDVASLTRVDDVGLYDINGEVLTGKGAVLKAADFTPLRQLQLGQFGLTDCRRLGDVDVCAPAVSVAPGYRVLLDHASGEFIGSYQPPTVADADVKSGCDNVGVRTGSMGLDDAELTPIGANSVLVSTLKSGATACALQVWTFH